ncbi:MAG: cysteine desulfurase / selenocysteine lyase [Euryarchaeota archaeon]|nr:cysteine desulfurase / selenocysteine lyase [Euryarchaeota archaeon]
MDVQEIRKDFPLLKDVIYLDSASTSLTPEPVLDAVRDYYHSYKANVGRGVYRIAQLADQRFRDAHRKAADFIGASGHEDMTIFTRNTTESINIVARGLQWKRGDRIVTTLLEHHSNLLPWMRLKEKGVELEIIKPDKTGMIDPDEYEKAIAKGTRLVAVSQLSNALGTVLPVKEIGKICRERGAALLVDGAQSVPHMPIDVTDMDCDFLCFSGHKMLAPMGNGVLWIKKEGDVEPLLVGGGMVADVGEDGYDIKKGYEGYEAGTPDISAGIGLGAGVDYLTGVGIEDIHHHEQMLTEKLLEGLVGIEGVVVYGPGPGSSRQARGGVVSFTVKGLLPHEVALMLDQASNICVRSGHHCCIPLMKHLGLKYGTVRASLYLYNTEEEIEKLLATLEQIARMA